MLLPPSPISWAGPFSDEPTSKIAARSEAWVRGASLRVLRRLFWMDSTFNVCVLGAMSKKRECPVKFDKVTCRSRTVNLLRFTEETIYSGEMKCELFRLG
jgi:hypothetical protein